jgi:hypothetical protein
VAQDQVGMLVAELEVFRRQVAKTFGGQAEQQGDRVAGADVRRQGIVGQAALEERPAIVVVEQVLGLLTRDGGDGQLTGEPTARGPFQEVADQISPLAGGPGDPVVDVLLGEVGEVVTASLLRVLESGEPEYNGVRVGCCTPS